MPTTKPLPPHVLADAHQDRVHQSVHQRWAMLDGIMAQRDAYLDELLRLRKERIALQRVVDAARRVIELYKPHSMDAEKWVTPPVSVLSLRGALRTIDEMEEK